MYLFSWLHPDRTWSQMYSICLNLLPLSRYEILYKQAVTAQDTFLNMGLIDPSSNRYFSHGSLTLFESPLTHVYNIQASLYEFLTFSSPFPPLFLSSCDIPVCYSCNELVVRVKLPGETLKKVDLQVTDTKLYVTSSKQYVFTQSSSSSLFL